jgi:hypothetical protein
MQLPINLSLGLMQTRWKGILDPLLASLFSSASIVSGVELINGITVVNHKLGRTPQGWFITDINGAATIYRSAPFNNLTLTLTSSAAVNVNIGVF